MLRLAGIVLSKTLRDALRDRRSLASALFYAIWGPLVMAMALTALARDRGPEPPITLPVTNLASAPALATFLKEQRVVVVEVEGDLPARIGARDWPVGLTIPADYPASIGAQRPATLILWHDGAWSVSSRHLTRLRTLLAEYGRRMAGSRLILRGVAPSVAEPLRVQERDLSTAAARAATVLGTLPIFLLVAVFVGGMAVAADEMAGERERRSLESLLVHPVPRAALVAGKLGATCAVALATVTLTILSMRVVLQHPQVLSMDLPVGLSAADSVGMWLVVAPLVTLVAALQLLVALFARSFKEAQTQLSLLMFLPMIPGFLFAFGSVAERPWMEWAPLVAQQVMLSAILRGEPPTATHLAAVGGLTMAAAAVVGALTARLLAHESIVRRLS